MRFEGRLRAILAATALWLATLPAFAQDPKLYEGWPASERILALFKEGNYAAVVAQAPAVIRAEPWNNELKFAYAQSLLWSGRELESVEHFGELLESEHRVEARLGYANALSWTGRMHLALPHYLELLETPKKGEAQLGLANALSWMGRQDLAIPYYEDLRRTYPQENVGEEGLFYARRAVRARTTAGFNFNRDNSPTRRREPYLSHEWRDSTRTWIFGVEGSGGEDWNRSLRLDRREYGFRVENIDWKLAPKLTVSRETEPRGNTFAELRLKLTPWPLYVAGGRVNWGKQAFTLSALQQGLTANRLGLEGVIPTGRGEFRGFLNYYSISDDNHIINSDIRFRWRPVVFAVKPFVGVAWRSSGHTDPDYWSPRRYGAGFVGLEREWIHRYWLVTAHLQAGFKLVGEASTSWGAVVTAKRWFGDDWAVGVVAATASGTRESKYRADSVGVTLEKYW